MLRKISDFRKRTNTAIQILEMRRIIGGACRLLLIYRIRSAPQASIIAEIHQAVRAEGRIENVLRGRDLRRDAPIDIGRIAPRTAVGETASKYVTSAYEQ